MYTGTNAMGSGLALAATGLTIGSYALIGVGLIVAGITLVAIFRKSGKNRP